MRRAREAQRERERERIDKDVKAETERGAVPGDEAVAMPKSQEDPNARSSSAHAHTRSRKVNKGEAGGSRSVRTMLPRMTTAY